MGRVGDFNTLREPKDRRGGAIRWPRHYDDFRNCIEAAILDDLRYRGLFYTWQTLTIRRKIDRVLVNEKWMETFHFSDAEFTSHIVADHTPMIVGIGTKISSGPKPFKFLLLLDSTQRFFNCS